jgi:hypothetical protein
MDRVIGPDAEWVMYTIRDRPADFPDRVVVTSCLINRPHPEELPGVLSFTTVTEAREHIQLVKPSATLIPRDPEDVPSIVESWF